MNDTQFFEAAMAPMTVALFIALALNNFTELKVFSAIGDLMMSFFVVRWYLRAKRLKL